MHNGGGRMLWAVDFGRHPDGAHTKATAQLLPWRSSHDVQHPPEVMCAGQGITVQVFFLCAASAGCTSDHGHVS